MSQELRSLTRLRLVGLLALALSASALAQDRPERSLYQRLGGYDVIAAITDDFLGRMRADPRFGRFAGGRSLDSRTRARQLTVDFLCERTGGPCVYIGRPMKTAHAGLGVTAAEWEAFAQHVAASLERLKVPAQESAELRTLIANLGKEIVEAGRN